MHKGDEVIWKRKEGERLVTFDGLTDDNKDMGLVSYEEGESVRFVTVPVAELREPKRTPTAREKRAEAVLSRIEEFGGDVCDQCGKADYSNNMEEINGRDLCDDCAKEETDGSESR